MSMNQFRNFCSTIYYIELPKLHAVHSTLEKFLYWIKFEGKEDAILTTLIKEDEVLGIAHKQNEKFSSDDTMRDLYLQREMYIRDKLSAIEYAEKQGELKGKIEGKIEVARKLLSQNLSIELVADVTGLSVEELQSLK
ncbi:MAG TPA: hypothetical protein DDY71_11075 [Spirochaetia bacterium]|nr:hypothetical protein [Spirochaetia bacterium]HBI38177.1 hypothetical protein [Spirochaetia bacterium]